MLRPCVEEYARNLEITTDDAYALLKKNYDGYHFSRNSKDVYAPFSVLRAFDGRNIDHWRVADADGNITDEQVFGL